jgi:hypothetical protein
MRAPGSSAIGKRLGLRLLKAKLGALEKRGQFPEAMLQSFELVRSNRDMAEFAPRAWGFSVQVKVSIGDTEDFFRFR